VSSVIFADLCPSIRDSARTLTPALIEIEAHVSLRSCGVRAACNAGHIGRKVCGRWLISQLEIERYKLTFSRRSA
jgi:hypothetical protein